jgi:hypothetical protein
MPKDCRHRWVLYLAPNSVLPARFVFPDVSWVFYLRRGTTDL